MQFVDIGLDIVALNTRLTRLESKVSEVTLYTWPG